MHGFNRRQVLVWCVALAAAPTVALARPSVLHAFVQESGKPSPRTAGRFAVGGLFIKEPQRLAAKLAQIRRETGFRAALRYADTNRHKLAYALRAMDAALDEPGARFAVRLAAPAGWPGDLPARRAAYHALYAELLDDGAGGPVILHKAAHRAVGRDEALHAHLLASGTTTDIAPISPALADVAQMAAFLTGCAAGAQQPPRNPVKAALIHHLAARLGVPALHHASLAANPRFTVTEGAALS